MSAYLVDHEHINVMLWAATRPHGHAGPLRWNVGNPIDVHQLQANNLDEVGQMLLDENAASVDHLYNDSTDVGRYSYRRPTHTEWSVPELLNALHCYQYQACEHPDWKHSEAFAFCQAFQQRLIHMLPGYSDGPWGITTNRVPVAVQKRDAAKNRPRSLTLVHKAAK